MNKLWQIIKKIFQKADAKHIIMLSSGVLLGQAVAMLLQPIATRLYSPEAFGCLSLVVSFGTMFAPVTTLQYHISIVHSPDEDEFPLCKLVLLCVCTTSLLLLLGLLVILVLDLEEYRSVGYWILFGAVINFLSGITNCIESYNNRHSEYALMTKVTVYRATAGGIAKVLFGLFHFETAGLVLSQCVGTISGIRKQSQSIIKHWKEILSVSFSDVWRMAKKYSEQPFFAMPGIFILQFSYSFIPVIINTCFSTRDGGFFSITIAILGLPLSLISNNVSRVFFKNASLERNKTGCFADSFKSTAMLLTVVSILGFALLWLIAEPLFGFVYGTEWVRSGLFTKLLIPMYAARFIVTGLMHGFVICKKQKTKTFLQSLFIVAILGGFVMSKYFTITVEQFLTYINWTYFILYALLFVVLWKYSRLKTNI